MGNREKRGMRGTGESGEWRPERRRGGLLLSVAVLVGGGRRRRENKRNKLIR